MTAWTRTWRWRARWVIGVCDSQTGAKSLCVLTGITKEREVAACEERVAPEFFTSSVADVRDILVFGEDMTNEDEEKQAIAELERLKQERRERKRRQREERRKVKEEREREIEEGKQMMREELERMEKEEREKGGDASNGNKDGDVSNGNKDGSHNANDNADGNTNHDSQPKPANAHMNNDVTHETVTQETLVTEEDLGK